MIDKEKIDVTGFDRDYANMWLKAKMGIQFKNPLNCTKFYTTEGEIWYFGDHDDCIRRHKYINHDLPDGFTDDELKELDEFMKEREL